MAPFCDQQLAGTDSVEIVSGDAEGADKQGQKYAADRGYPVKLFKADWKRFKRAAGPKRNQEMAVYATHLIAFWDGKSKGTASMINLARKAKLIVRICYYEPKTSA